MTVPAGDVVRVLAHHALRAVDHVLEDLVQRVPDMEMAVGVRRTVMQDELLPPHRLFAQAVVEAKPFPALEQLRLALGQSGLHREVGLGQEQGRAPVAPDLRRLGLRCGDCRRWARSLRLASRLCLPGFGLAFALARTAGFFADSFGLRLGDFHHRLARRLRRGLGRGLGRFRLGGLGRFAGLAFAAGFTVLAGAFALAAGLTARFVLARDDALLFLLFAIDPCFPSHPARNSAVPAGF